MKIGFPTVSGLGVLAHDPGDMAHLAAGAGVALAVEVQMGAGLGQNLAPAQRGVADQILHLDPAPAGGISQREAADGADMLVELRGLRALARPMPGIMHAGRDLIDDDALGVTFFQHEHLDGEDADIAERFADATRGFSRGVASSGREIRRNMGEGEDMVAVLVLADVEGGEGTVEAARGDRKSVL
ncbi:hypothetical protein BO1005MUT1_210266 [Hyphomicrobiales bacterium]|nr:hypothetical protein BO1005MUT1_210266 [Hyphomicrobiales bacterium]